MMGFLDRQHPQSDRVAARHLAPPPAKLAAPTTVEALFALSGWPFTAQPDQMLCAQGDTIDTVFRVERGTLRTCLYTPSGDRHILRFAGPGSVHGLVDVDRWRTTVEAVDLVVLRAVRKRDAEAAMQSSDRIRREMRSLAATLATERDAHLITVAKQPAVDRVRAFLRAFAGARPPGTFVTLPMGRRDIGDHLGLSIETVSRAFTKLKDLGAIEMKGNAMYRMTGIGATDPGPIDLAEARHAA